jgi:hypothetical protein
MFSSSASFLFRFFYFHTKLTVDREQACEYCGLVVAESAIVAEPITWRARSGRPGSGVGYSVSVPTQALTSNQKQILADFHSCCQALHVPAAQYQSVRACLHVCTCIRLET